MGIDPPFLPLQEYSDVSAIRSRSWQFSSVYWLTLMYFGLRGWFWATYAKDSTNRKSNDLLNEEGVTGRPLFQPERLEQGNSAKSQREP